MKKIIRFLVLFLLASPRVAAALEFPLTRNQRAQKLVEEGERQIIQGHYLGAIDSCNKALGIRGDWSPAYLCRSEAKLRSKDAAAASEDAEKAKNLDPKNGEPFRILGILEFAAGRYEKAVEYFSRALKLTKLRPENVSDVYYWRASSYLNMGKYQYAMGDVQEGLGVLRGVNGDYSDWKFFSLRAEIYRRMGDGAKADVDETKVVKLIDERIRMNPPDVLELLRSRAESHMLLRDYSSAAEDLDHLLAENGGDIATLVDQANVYSLAGRHKEALADLDRALRVDPSQLAALRLRSMERFSLGDADGAMSDLDAALAINANDVSALTARGILKRYLGDYQGSLKDLQSAQKLNPKDSGLWGHEAFDLEMLQNHQAAMDLAEKTLKEDPDNASARTAFGLAATALGRCDAAMPALDDLIRQSPDSGQYYWLRAECRCKGGRYRGCLDDMKSAQSLEPGSPFLALRLAQVCRQTLDRLSRPTLQDLRDCTAYYDRAMALKPLDLDSRLERARTMIDLAEQLKLGAFARERAALLRRAADECEDILQQHPENLKARRLLDRAR